MYPVLMHILFSMALKSFISFLGCQRSKQLPDLTVRRNQTFVSVCQSQIRRSARVKNPPKMPVSAQPTPSL